MKILGADIIIECLKEQGVDTVFGYPGGQAIVIYDALYRARNEIRHILTSHEQGASHAADGYARATGKVGVCIATSGPGATNLVTGIATAYMDSVPMVAITGQVPTGLLGKDSFQEVDITGITMPITKHNFIVKDVTKLADTIRKAFAIAREGRPGPVLVDICKDVTATEMEYTPRTPGKDDYISNKYHEISGEEFEAAIKAINSAFRPVILSGAGVGIAGAEEEVRSLAESACIPVSTSLMGMGTFPGTHELFMGMVGMHGTKTSNYAVHNCDLFIAIGNRFSDRIVSKVSSFAPGAEVMHIDVDSAEVGKNISVDYPLVGNIKQILQTLIKGVEPKRDTEWISKVNAWKEKYPLKYNKSSEVLRPQYIVERLHELTHGDAVITTEVGQHQMWAAQYYKYTRFRQFVSSGGLGTMGYGLGACIGAQLGRPDKKVINIAGDGSFRMNLNELATAVEYKLPIIIALFNNRALGMVRQWQELFYDSRFSQTTIDRGTNFKALAEAFGAKGINVTHPDQVDGAIRAALSETDTPVLINFEIDKDDKVFPIVPPGAGINEVVDC
ncbi:biosynthetic-type acetolactate synthase large subunit [Ruminiclostridium cellobioparum]|jgi:acetolactate synthase I/II/III large subunit|uniref:Acetolactate synthase n=1 Tax=Ruminiclostridium cellobioparum subsp. termitidis CT1112 TaxID=1195236 RepID=S0FY80_RUMCE|nr:biosynthetic-type acetolactate synthase large subunit [Ruminiclostridium cellobioparum]EMS74079.1 acetolactate synthase, large subunit, biosynthetic type [Ruminiclostridium cellobioparum subsp. termitidis CT1112]